MFPEHKLVSMGIVLPSAPKPVAAYQPARVTSHGLVVVSGQLPWHNGALLATGPVPSHVSVEMGVQCARQCALNVLAAMKECVIELDRVIALVRVGVYVNSDPGFTGHSIIANGASELLNEVFDNGRGQHARAAVGCVALPLGAPVEVEVMAQIDPAWTLGLL